MGKVLSCLLFFVWLIIASELVWDLGNIGFWVASFISLSTFAVCIVLYYYFDIWRKPLLSARGKIVRKYRPRGQYYLDILLADKSIIKTFTSKEQFNAIEKDDEVDITTKGRYLASIKKQGTQEVIITDEIGVKKSDFIKAKPMPLNNKDTTAYDKWMTEEREIAERKRKNAEKNKRKTGRF